MKLHLDSTAEPINGEQELLSRLERLHKRSDKACIGRIGVKNGAGQVRMAIFAFTDAELDGATKLLEDRNFSDELFEFVEHDDGEGGIEMEPVQHDHPSFEYLYSPATN